MRNVSCPLSKPIEGQKRVSLAVPVCVVDLEISVDCALRALTLLPRLLHIHLAAGLRYKQVEGFGVTVGRAVALLHVVRHGLRSQELWSLLAALKASSSAQEKVRPKDVEWCSHANMPSGRLLLFCLWAEDR